MSLSNIDKEHANQLICAINTQNVDHNTLEVLKTNYLHYGKLKQIAKQMEQLKQEAAELIKDSYQQNMLQKVECRSKKISGNTYHLYCTNKDKHYLSLIGPNEWGENSSFSDNFIGSYYYDFDKTFVEVDNLTHAPQNTLASLEFKTNP